MEQNRHLNVHASSSCYDQVWNTNTISRAIKPSQEWIWSLNVRYNCIGIADTLKIHSLSSLNIERLRSKGWCSPEKSAGFDDLRAKHIPTWCTSTIARKQSPLPFDKQEIVFEKLNTDWQTGSQKGLKGKVFVNAQFIPYLPWPILGIHCL